MQPVEYSYIRQNYVIFGTFWLCFLKRIDVNKLSLDKLAYYSPHSLKKVQRRTEEKCLSVSRQSLYTGQSWGGFLKISLKLLCLIGDGIDLSSTCQVILKSM